MIIIVTQELIQLFVSFTSVNCRDNKLAYQICYLDAETISGSGELYKIQASLTNKSSQIKKKILAFSNFFPQKKLLELFLSKFPIV